MLALGRSGGADAVGDRRRRDRPGAGGRRARAHLRLAALPEYDRALRERIAAAYPEAALYIYGHLGDGNLHVNLVGPEPEDDGVDELVLRCTVEHGGTISAEHGVGIAKRAYLSLCRSREDIGAMRALKSALDPGDLLGPGRVLP